MKLLLAAASTALIFAATEASARCDRYGNCYSGGYGYNYNTGSQWHSRGGYGGSTYGMDSRGNSWSYNRRSGTYFNYGTGEIRHRGRRW